MTKDEKAQGCVSPAAGPIVSESGYEENDITVKREEKKMQVKIGAPAPDFEASAFYEGGFQNIKLSDYRGGWVFLCFYPGDFTFV